MRYLLEFAERNDVRSFVAETIGVSGLQGVVVDYDPYWLYLWRLRSVLGERYVADYVERFLPFYQRGLPFTALPDHGMLLLGTTGEAEPPNPSWRPPYWSEIARHRGYGKNDETAPFVIKVCLLPTLGEGRIAELGGYPFKVLFERRAQAELFSPLRSHRPVIGGVSIGDGPRKSATLGGVVQDQFGKHWGVTCAHALNSANDIDQPAQADGGSPAVVGKARHVSTLRPSPAGQACNPYNLAAVHNPVDSALIDFDPSIASELEVLHCGGLSGTVARGDLDPGTLIEIVGKESGTRTLEVGGLGLTYRMKLRGSTTSYCFNHFFELRWPSVWQLAKGRPVRSGDSGAWIISAGASGYEWAGMVVGGDRLVGYAQFAEDVVTWADAQHGLHIAVT